MRREAKAPLAQAKTAICKAAMAETNNEEKTLSYPIPKDALDDRLAIVGTAGAGKTYAALGAIEHLLARKSRVIMVDPLGVAWGLRLCADGKTPSPYQPVIFGGAHGDLPINEHAGALIGQTVATMRESCIIDLSQLGTKNAERRFMLAFLTALYRETDKEPVHLIVDEADMFAPQRLLDKEGDAAKLLGMMETIVRRGRVKGFIPWLLTQRPAVLSKDVLSQTDGLVALKLTSSQDRDAIGAWIEGQADKAEGRAMLASLPAKQRGEGVLWIPGRDILRNVTFPPKATYDSSRTPKRGEKREARELKPLDLGALKDRLATVETEAKANDPKALRTELAKANAELAKLRKNANCNEMLDPKAIEVAREEGARIIREQIPDMLDAQHAQSFRLGFEFLAARRAVYEPDFLPRRPSVPSIDEMLTAKLPKVAPVAHRIEQRLPKVQAICSSRAGHTNGSLSGPLRRIVDAIAWWSVLGHERPTRTQVAFVAGYKPNTGTFNTYLGSLSTSGMISYPAPGLVALTDDGRLAAEFPAAPSGDELRERVKRILSGPQTKILDALIEGYPASSARDELATASGYAPNTGTFNTYLGSLSTLGIIEYPERGKVSAANWLFPN